MEELSKEHKVAMSKWYRQLMLKNKGRWDETIGSIENPYLQSKVACMVFWDCYEDEEEYSFSHMVDQDFSYHIPLMNMYRPYFEEGFMIHELIDALIMVGYPKAVAEKRAQPPKTQSPVIYK